MIERDLLVGCIACGLGFALVFSGLVNSDRFFSMPTPERLVRHLGRSCARWVLSLAGLVIILLGMKIFVSPHSSTDIRPSASAPGIGR
ncbi:MAG TPA: hypothetical protein PKD54_02205 [Pirellulaceae bacterium]|nr:hypothetical protein [Pirellulaceae bacterium]